MLSRMVRDKSRTEISEYVLTAQDEDEKGSVIYPANAMPSSRRPDLVKSLKNYYRLSNDTLTYGIKWVQHW